MTKKITGRKLVIVNQAANYLTIDLANAFCTKFEEVSLVSGTIHAQGSNLDPSIRIRKVTKLSRSSGVRKSISYITGLAHIYILLMLYYRRYEVLFLSIPPAGYLLIPFLPQRCSVLIWDVYPDTLKVIGMKDNHGVYRLWARLNKIAFSKSYKIFTIGTKMSELVSQYVDSTKIHITPLWSLFQKNESIDKGENPFIIQNRLSGKFIVQYSGNIGLTHRVELLIDIATILEPYTDIVFMCIGKGPRLAQIKEIAMKRRLSNCIFIPFQNDNIFPLSLSAADVGVVILDERTSKGSVPSKAYNLMSFAKPSLYIASEDSELYDYAERYEHAACFQESQLDEAATYILNLKEDMKRYDLISRNALKAASAFKLSNADKIVTLYLS